MTKVILDTNVYISAFIFGGNPRKIIELTQNSQITIYISPSILLEIAQKLKGKFQWNFNQIKHIIKTLNQITTITYPTKKINIIKSDPTDNKILECAVEAKAKYIISGDKHLLNLKQYKNIKILTPTQFLTHLPD